MGQSPHKGPSLVRDASPQSNWRQRRQLSLGDGWQVSGRSTESLDCLPSKWSERRSALPTDSRTSQPPEAEHRSLKSGPPLMRRLGILSYSYFWLLTDAWPPCRFHYTAMMCCLSLSIRSDQPFRTSIDRAFPTTPPVLLKRLPSPILLGGLFIVMPRPIY